MENRFAFVPPGTYHLKKILELVKARYAPLCDDTDLCEMHCTHGNKRPEWEHRVRTALQQVKLRTKVVDNGPSHGYWTIRQFESVVLASDMTPPAPDRIQVVTYRILRDTELARQIKTLHQNRCQICGTSIVLPGGRHYSEAHHIQPLGEPHSGPDVSENILVLCPNHHAICDYGAITLSLTNLRVLDTHVIGQQYVDYHNTNIARS